MRDVCLKLCLLSAMIGSGFGCSTSDPNRLAAREQVRSDLRDIATAGEDEETLRSVQRSYRNAVRRLTPTGEVEPAAPWLDIHSGKAVEVKVPRPAPSSAEDSLASDGLGLPIVVRVETDEETAPPGGYRTPRTVLGVLEEEDVSILAVDPFRYDSVEVAGRKLPLSTNFEAVIRQTQAEGPGMFSGLAYMLRTDRFQRSKLVFLQPYDPEKIPVVLVHGLLSTSQLWAPIVRGIWGDEELRRRYQIWAFGYPTGQPIQLSSLQLRDALDRTLAGRTLKHDLVVVGHSMGGLLTRSLVTELPEETAEQLVPGIAQLPESAALRRALVLEPRRDVARVVFLATPHRGSPFTAHPISALGRALIQLPGWLYDELGELGREKVSRAVGRIPNSIHGLSPESPFLKFVAERPIEAPYHSIIGNRGHSGELTDSSDGIVPYTSAHVPGALSEKIVPAGHGVQQHPETTRELLRILHLHLDELGLPGIGGETFRIDVVYESSK